MQAVAAFATAHCRGLAVFGGHQVGRACDVSGHRFSVYVFATQRDELQVLQLPT